MIASIWTIFEDPSTDFCCCHVLVSGGGYVMTGQGCDTHGSKPHDRWYWTGRTGGKCKIRPWVHVDTASVDPNVTIPANTPAESVIGSFCCSADDDDDRNDENEELLMFCSVTDFTH
jgi:hypothetical protein